MHELLYAIESTACKYDAVHTVCMLQVVDGSELPQIVDGVVPGGVGHTAVQFVFPTLILETSRANWIKHSNMIPSFIRRICSRANWIKHSKMICSFI